MKNKIFLKKRPMNIFSATIVTLALGIITTAPTAFAVQFQTDNGISGTFDTTMSYGAQWSMQDPDSANIAIANGGTSRAATNADDGKLNYKKGDLISSLFKVNHDLDLRYGNLGFFARGYYFYDAAAENLDSTYSEARDRFRNGGKILDAFLYTQVELFGKRATGIRIGNQVVRWGESTFLRNGISATSPVDLQRLRAPGRELKEAFIPTPMLYISQEISDTISFEAYYVKSFEETIIDPHGSFFSTTDILSDGGSKIFAGFGRRYDDNTAPMTISAAGLHQTWLNRTGDRHAKDSGQFGLSLRFEVPSLDTEFGLYHIVYHNQTPNLSFVSGDLSFYVGGNVIEGTGSYFADYAESVRLYGISFNTLGPAGIALQGEISHRPNQPLQLPGGDLFLYSANNPLQSTTQFGLAPVNGTVVTGYERVPMTQLQMTATKSFGPQFGSSQLVALAEVGYTHLSLGNDGPFAGPGVILPYNGFPTNLATAGSSQPGGYMTQDSWGYRVLARMTYSNAIGAIGASPRIAFAHDVNGIGPTFNEDAKALTLGVGFNYKQDWQADIAYTRFSDGRNFSGSDPIPPTAGQAAAGQTAAWKTSANPATDRDFLAVNISYSF